MDNSVTRVHFSTWDLKQNTVRLSLHLSPGPGFRISFGDKDGVKLSQVNAAEGGFLRFGGASLLGLGVSKGGVFS